jgi:hypothetical protein
MFSPDPLFRRKSLQNTTDEKFGRAEVLTIISSLRIHYYEESLINAFNNIPNIICSERCVIIYKITLRYTEFIVHAVKWDACRTETDELKRMLPTSVPTQRWDPAGGRRVKKWILHQTNVFHAIGRKRCKNASISFTSSVCVFFCRQSRDLLKIWINIMDISFIKTCHYSPIWVKIG